MIPDFFVSFQVLRTEVKEHNKELEYFADFKKMAEDKKRALRGLNQDKDDLIDQLRGIENDLKPLKIKQKELEDIAIGFSDIQNKYTEGKCGILY